MGEEVMPMWFPVLVVGMLTIIVFLAWLWSGVPDDSEPWL